jgi:beta-lactamase superfamily II metal-dependent hydrolase
MLTLKINNGGKKMNVKMYQMGCGESILMEHDNELLMIDFGSQDWRNRRNHYNYVESKLSNCKMDALITHFHEDHISGFINLMKNRIISFNTIYIPHVFTVGSHFNLIDYMLMDYYLQNKKTKGLPLLSLIKAICNNNGKYTLLKRGECFNVGGCINEVLWPIPNVIDRYLKEKNDYDIPIPISVMNKIMEISDEICEFFTEHNSVEINDYIQLLNQFEYQITELLETKIIKQDGKYIGLLNGTYIARTDYENYRNNINVHKFISSLKKKLKINNNAFSIVFQTDKVNDRRYLFTGDVTPKNINLIINNDDKTVTLKSDFFAVKAPHHGTKSHYVPNLYTYTDPEVVFISNGKGGHAGRIDSEYSKSKKYRLICTNTVNMNKKCDEKPCSKSLCPLHTKLANINEFDII